MWLPMFGAFVGKTRVVNLGFLAVKRNTGAKSIEESKEPHPGGH